VPERTPSGSSADATDAHARLSELGAGHWRLDGDLRLPQVARLAAGPPPGAPAGAPAGDVVLDLSGVRRTSSAAVALLLHWQAGLCTGGSRLLLLNTPRSLQRLAALSNVDALLGLADPDSAVAGVNPADGSINPASRNGDG
jgi:ABC-type transporter Mla MlaB component